MPAVAHLIEDYAGLVSAIRDRVDEIDISRNELDSLAGLADGYSGKLLSLKHPKRFGMASLGRTLGALGVKLLLVEDTEQTAKIRQRAKPRDNRQVRHRPKIQGSEIEK